MRGADEDWDSGDERPEDEQWIDPEQLTLQDELGRGAFGVVYRGKFLGTTVAVKKLFRASYGDVKEVKAHFEHEVKVLRTLRHPNIVLFMGIAEREGELYLVQEYIDGGSLRDLLSQQRDFGWKTRLKIAVEIARALAYLHAKGIWHRDLKCENILLTKNLDVKVADFGLARIFKRTTSKEGGGSSSGATSGSGSRRGGTSGSGIGTPDRPQPVSPRAPPQPTDSNPLASTDFEIISDNELITALAAHNASKQLPLAPLVGVLSEPRVGAGIEPQLPLSPTRPSATAASVLSNSSGPRPTIPRLSVTGSSTESLGSSHGPLSPTSPTSSANTSYASSASSAPSTPNGKKPAVPTLHISLVSPSRPRGSTIMGQPGSVEQQLKHENIQRRRSESAAAHASRHSTDGDLHASGGGIVSAAVAASSARPSIKDLRSGIRRLRTKGSQVGSPWWRAPEVDDTVYNYKIDIFSLGVVYLEIITGAEGEDIRLSMSYQKPGSLHFGVDPSRLSETFKEQAAQCPKQFWEMALLCCDENPTKRPEMESLIAVLQRLLDEFSALERAVQNVVPQKDGARLWISLLLSTGAHLSADARVSAEALLTELNHIIKEISDRGLELEERHFLVDLLLAFEEDPHTRGDMSSREVRRTDRVVPAVANLAELQISIQVFTRFWDWFYPLLKTISNPKILGLFRAGLIRGFVSKPRAKGLLHQTEPGTFLIRFSQTNPGNVVFTYVTAEQDTKDIVAQVTRDAIFIKEDTYPSIKDALESNPKLTRLKFIYPKISVSSPVVQQAHQTVDSRPSTPRFAYKSSRGL